MEKRLATTQTMDLLMRLAFMMSVGLVVLYADMMSYTKLKMAETVSYAEAQAKPQRRLVGSFVKTWAMTTKTSRIHMAHNMDLRRHALVIMSYIRVTVEEHQKVTPPYYNLEFTPLDHDLEEAAVYSQITDIAGRKYELIIRPIV